MQCQLVWVTGVTFFERAEDWGMVAIRELYPDFCVNKNGSCMTEKNVSPEQPNGCYWQPVRAYLGNIRNFEGERKQLDKENSGRHYADLGKRFQHPYVQRVKESTLDNI